MCSSDLWRRAGLHGWLFSTAWLTGSFWWLFISMHTYGGLPAPLAAIAVLALAAALGLYYAVAAAWFVVKGPQGRVASALVFAALWTLAELVRGSWFTGFPWGAGGYAHVEGPSPRSRRGWACTASAPQQHWPLRWSRCIARCASRKPCRAWC